MSNLKTSLLTIAILLLLFATVFSCKKIICCPSPQPATYCSFQSNVLSLRYDSCYYVLPTAFTPNGDGTNDILRGHSNNVAGTYSFTVVDASNNTIFTTTDLYASWNGNITSAPIYDNYIVRLHVEFADGKKIDTCCNIHLSIYNRSTGCIPVDTTTMSFEDQFDPSTWTLKYKTNENVCK